MDGTPGPPPPWETRVRAPDRFSLELAETASQPCVVILEGTWELRAQYSSSSVDFAETIREGSIVLLRAHKAIHLEAAGTGGELLILKLAPEALRLAPKDALRLVDGGFRLPYLDPEFGPVPAVPSSGKQEGGVHRGWATRADGLKALALRPGYG